MSYPHGTARGHAARVEIMHPNLPFIARAAEEAGTDLQVLFLYRPVQEALVSGCFHRSIEKRLENGDCELYVETLVSNAAILLRHLKSIGGAQVHCFRYG